MKKTTTYAGRSLVFNVLFILLNLTGLVLVTLGYHKEFETQSTLLKASGFVLMLLSIVGVLIFKGKLMFAAVARVLVGGLFIVSGLVKANDPLGFAYKLEEYFEDGALAYRIKEWFSSPAFSLEFLMDYALTLSVLICIVEIVLGVLVIIGGKIKLVSYLMLGMMVFFTFLTWHTATCDATTKFVDRDTYAMSDPIAQFKIDEAKTNKDLKVISKNATTLVVEEKKQPQCVNDCGCFGDAMKGSIGRSLTPVESLWKDIILMYLVVWIFLAQWTIKPNSKKENLVFFTGSLLVVTFFSWIFTWYLPIWFGALSILSSLWLVSLKKKWFSNYWMAAALVTVWCLMLSAYVLRYEPIRDYRAYAVGNNLKEKMNDGEEGIYENVLVYKNKKTKEVREYSSTSKEYTNSKIWENPDWVYKTMTQKEIKATKIPSITDQFNPFIGLSDISELELSLDFVREKYEEASLPGVKLRDIAGAYELDVPLSEYNTTDYPESEYAFIDSIYMFNPEITEISLRDFVVKAPRIVILNAKNLEEANWSNLSRIKQIASWCTKESIPFVMICSAGREEINAFRSKNKFNFPVFANDETELKAISRSNPAILVIEKGIVKAKYPHRSIPEQEVFKTKHGN